MDCRSLHCLDGTENSLFESLQACFLRKRDKEVPLETSLRFSEEESPPQQPCGRACCLLRNGCSSNACCILFRSWTREDSRQVWPSGWTCSIPREPLGVYVMVVSLRPALRKGFNHTLHHVPTSYRPPFQHISTSYCFRIVSVLFPLPEARTIGGW